MTVLYERLMVALSAPSQGLRLNLAPPPAHKSTPALDREPDTTAIQWGGKEDRCVRALS